MTDDTREPLFDVSAHETIRSILEQVELAEESGYGSVLMGEATGWNRVALLALIAERTDELRFSNDVFSPYSRSPALLGQTAAVLQAISGVATGWGWERVRQRWWRTGTARRSSDRSDDSGRPSRSSATF